MNHLGPEQVRRQFKGMVERCRDCGFDLAGGLVEVVPTAHYMMGGVVFGPDCSTALAGLYAAGEDTGGVHGANRLGGNGVANSTVFGGVAGDRMVEWVGQAGAPAASPDGAEIERAIEACERPFRQAPGDLNAVREALFELMWDRVGILRHARGLQEADLRLRELAGRIEATGVADATRAYNLTWHDWLNLRNLIFVSRAIAAAAAARESSAGAHYREDFPQSPAPAQAAYASLQWYADNFDVRFEPVAFTRVRPGETLLEAQETTPCAS